MNRKDLVESELQFGKIFASLEFPNAPFAETILFEVFSEDFEGNSWGTEHGFIHLRTLN
jgi:hypothetical protein